MLVISNLCYGGYFYKYMNVQYNNPFIWCRVYYDSIYYLMNNWGTVDFKKFEIRLSNSPHNSYEVLVDNSVKIKYTHYLFDPKAESPIRDMNFDKRIHNYWIGDIRFKDMEKYIFETYTRRVERMLSEKENPVFLLRDDEYPKDGFSKTTIQQIADNSKFKTVIITGNKRLSTSNKNCKIIAIEGILQIHPEIQIRQNLSEIKSFLL